LAIAGAAAGNEVALRIEGWYAILSSELACSAVSLSTRASGANGLGEVSRVVVVVSSVAAVVVEGFAGGVLLVAAGDEERERAWRYLRER
jgi:hypothetical protein